MVKKLPDQTTELDTVQENAGSVARPAADSGQEPTAILKFDAGSRFRLLRVLGRGGCGIVFLAEDKDLDRLVAIKQVRTTDQAVDSRQLANLHLEAKIAGRLEHPNVIIVYDIEGQAAGFSIVMEYLGGGSLGDLLAKQPRLDLRPALRIMFGVLSGLEAAHGIQVVHRDIKPQNILFGFGGIPKLADFGVASYFNTSQEGAQIVGTPHYMAPEQWRGEATDPRTDIYSAGSVFYEMLTGIPVIPHDFEADLEGFRDFALSREPANATAVCHDLPVKLWAILKKMLAKDPAARYSGAAAVLADLYLVAASLPRDEFALERSLNPLAGGLLNSPGTVLEDILYLLLLDGVISPTERQELAVRAQRLGFSQGQVDAVERKVRKLLATRGPS